MSDLVKLKFRSAVNNYVRPNAFVHDGGVGVNTCTSTSYINRILIAILLCLNAGTLTAQQNSRSAVVRGTVKNAVGEPVAFANVYIKDTHLCTQSDLEGNFLLRVVQGKCTLCVTMVGYASHEQEIEIKQHERKSIQIQLEEQTNNLDEVTVTASNRSWKIREIVESPMAISVVDGAKLRGITSGIEDILKRTSGLTVRQTGGLGSESRISVHGLEGKRVAVFIDGFALNSPDG
jgi:hypothetical protein